MNYLLVSVLCLMLMACSEHKPNLPKASSQQTISLSGSATKLPKTQLIHGWSKEQVQLLQRQTAKAVGLNNGVSFHDNFIIDGEQFSGPKLVLIPPAIFLMGCFEGNTSCFPREDIKALITISYPFAVSEREVSNADWALCVKAGYCESSYSITGNADFAVTSVSWSETQAYTHWLSVVTGQRYRLFSESEHEHASRAGGTGALLGNNIDCSGPEYQKANAKSDSCYFNPKERNTNFPLEQLLPNAFGLLNIHRGRWEWLLDCWHDSIFDNTPKDGSPYKEKGGCKSGLYVARGGDMGGLKIIVRSSNRHIGRKNQRFQDVGFRLAREIN